MVIVKYCNINVIEDHYMQYYLSLLPPFMHNDVLKYKYVADQKSRLIARLMLQEALIDTGAAGLIKQWKRNSCHKPEISSWNSFNISHSSDLVIFTYTAAISIGIDIEKKGVIEHLGLMKYFHPTEQQFILDSANANDSFYQVWVRKEAVLKAIGKGIVDGISEFNCLGEMINYKEQEWHLRELRIHPDYTCYVCAPRLDEHIVIQEFQVKSILMIN